MSFFYQFCRDAMALDVLHMLGMPLKIQWILARSREPWWLSRGSILLERCLRMEWPEQMEDGTPRYMAILRRCEVNFNDKFWIEYQSAEDRRGSDFVHGSSAHLVYTLPLPLGVRWCFETRFSNRR